MGLIRDALGSAMGANKVQNGFNGPSLPFRANGNHGMNQAPPPTFNHQGQDSYQQDLYQQDLYQQGPYQKGTYQQDTYQQSAYHQRAYEPDSYQSDVYPPQGAYQSSPSPAYYTQSQDHSIGYHQNTDTRNHSGLRPLALPQIAHGDGKPFLRGYSDELAHYGISEQEFFQVLDSVNVAVIPNPEVQIFQKGANIAGWFIPGSASLGLMAGQVGVGVASAFGHASLVSRNLSKANLSVFLPKGLEICIGKTKDVNAEIGINASDSYQQDPICGSPENRVAAYGPALAPLTRMLPPLEIAGRRDPIAMLGRGIGNRDDQRKEKRAQKRMDKGKSKRMDSLEQGLKWLMVRRATPEALAHWQTTLKQSESALRQEQNAANQ